MYMRHREEKENGCAHQESICPYDGNRILYFALSAAAEPRIRRGKKVKEMTGGEVLLSPGTMYGSLSKMEKDGVISFVREEEKRKIYVITQLGREILELERKRIERLHRNAEEEMER